MEVLGIDIGGSGIKGAPVDIKKGKMLSERHRIPTPQPSKPKDVARVVNKIIRYFAWDGPVGCGFPAIVQDGVVLSAANVHKSWVGTDAEALFNKVSGYPIRVVNDADAAGLAEMKFGAGKGRKGTVMVITLGTGIGSALFINGHLVPNTELGHIEINCDDAEKLASDAARKREDLSWKKWGKRLNEYLQTLENLFSPELFILGGGVSKKHEKFIPRLSVRARVVPAQLRNEAGIVGAAMAATVKPDK